MYRRRMTHILMITLYSVVVMASCDKVEYFAPSIFLNHGGGPNPVLGEIDNLEIADSLRNVSKLVQLERLKAIIVVTAHREEDIVTISSGEHHDLVYDYNNFPPESYKFKYGAPGHPILAGRIHEAFQKEGIPSRLDDKRGWDHGVFIPMMLVNPSADIPVVQVSILKNQDAKQHLDIGKVLYQFREEGIAVFGSGMSYHNMQEFRKVRKNDDNADNLLVNTKFDEYLNEVCTKPNRKEDIVTWSQEAEGLDSHPLGEADHLMPLIVNIGAGGNEPGEKIFQSVFLKKFKLSGFIWNNK